MILFSLSIGLLLIVTILVLTFPLWNRTSSPIPMGPEASADQERIDLDIERQTLMNSLAELDLDLAQGRLTPPDYQRLKLIDENRLGRILLELDSLPTGTVPPARRTRTHAQPREWMKWVASAGLVLVVVGTAAAIFSYVNGKIGLEAEKRYAESEGNPATQGMPNPAEMVAKLEKHLRDNPNDLQGQIMAGRSYMTLQRIDDARRAWGKVLELDSGNYEGHFFMGVIILQTASPEDPKSSEEALNHFETALVKVPRDPAILWYKGVALLRLKQYDLVDKSWTEAFQNLTPGTEDSEFVKKALQSLRAGNPPAL
jgi:cytochrome c-type biogenesis protein CcmH